MRPRIALVLLVAVVSGCASSAAARPRTNAPIALAELQQSSATTVLAAVRELRPHWTSRLAGAFLDGQPVPPSYLQQEPLNAIAEIRLLSAEAATARYGTRSFSGNYLEVVRRR